MRSVRVAGSGGRAKPALAAGEMSADPWLLGSTAIRVKRYRSSRRTAGDYTKLTRSSTILDPAIVGPDEAIILCPANHSPPTRVAPCPAAPGYEAVAACLASPEVRARVACQPSRRSATTATITQCGC